MRRQFLLVLMIVFSLLPTSAQATSTLAPIVMTNRYAANEQVRIIVTLHNDYSPGYSALSAPQLAARHATVTRQVHSFRDRNRALFATVHREFNVFSILAVTVMGRDIERIAGLPEVARIEEDQARPAVLDESGEVIHSRAVVEGGYAGAGSTVVVFDTGVKADHPFLRGRVIAEACFSTNNSNLQITSLCPRGTTFETGPGAAAPCATLCDHGTHVAGIIAGQRVCLNCNTAAQMQMSGVAPEANIIAVQVFSRNNNDRSCRNAGQAGAPCVIAWDSDIQAALQWVFNNRNAASWGRVAAINMSLGGGQFFRACDAQFATYATWITQLRSVEIASVIASGNASFTNAVASPACIQSAVTVGATMTRRANSVIPGSSFDLSRQDRIANYSNTPQRVVNVIDANGDRLLDILAPGSNIYSSIATANGYAVYSGTSMATPHVAGAFAILKGIQPNATVRQIMQTLQTTGVPVTHSNGLVASRIDLAAAVSALKNVNVTTQLSRYSIDFGRITKNDTVVQSVGIQTRALAHQTLSISIVGSGFAINRTTCRNYLDDQISSCSVVVSFRPTATRQLQISAGKLTFTVDGVPMTVGLVGRNSLTTPDVGVKATHAAQSRSPTRTATTRPTHGPLAATILAAATRTFGAVNRVATEVAIARTQVIFDDRRSATAERTQGLPTRTSTATMTRMPTSTPIAIVQTVSAALTATAVAQTTRVVSLSQTAVAATQDQQTATAERASGSPTRTAVPSKTLSATVGVYTATPTPTAESVRVTRSTTTTTDIVGVKALPAAAGYVVLERGSVAAASSLAVVDRNLGVLKRKILPGESANALATLPSSPWSYIVAGRLYDAAMYIQRYDVTSLTPVLAASHLVTGDGSITAAHAVGDVLYVGMRVRTTAASPERYEVRAYDIRSPTDIVALPGVQASLPGPISRIVDVPQSDLIVVVGSTAATTTGYVSTYKPKPTSLQLCSRSMVASPVMSVVVQSRLDGVAPNALVLYSDRLGITGLPLNPTTGVLAAAPAFTRAGAADVLALDGSQRQLVSARYDASALIANKTTVLLYDIEPTSVRLRTAAKAVPGSAVVQSIDATAGQLVVASGRMLSVIAGSGSLAPTLTPSPTLTASVTPTITATATASRTRTQSATMTTTATAVAESQNRLSAGTAHTCLLTLAWDVTCWGDSAYGQTGAGVLAAQTTPRPVLIGASAPVRQLAGAWNHHCVRTSDGTFTCWGDNGYGELGDLTPGTAPNTPVSATVLAQVRHIGVGWHHACAITTDRTVLCWGLNSQRQLGNSVTTDATSAQVVFDVSGVTQLALGATHSCALLASGKVMCWGGNTYGQLGQGNTTTYTKAVLVPVTGVTSISTFNNHTCALTTAKTVSCWGANTYGQSGGAVLTSSVTSPSVVKRSSGASSVALGNVAGVEAGFGHSCAYDTTGAVYCWGDNFYGQLAKDTATVFTSALALPISGVTASDEKVIDVATGEKHSCTLLSTGAIKCWGNNQYGQLGTGAVGSAVVTTPVAVVGLP